VADDDHDVRRFAVRVLCSGGFEVDEVCSGFEASQALSLRSYDVCVADIKMPGNERLELVRALQTNHLVPLVLMTGEPSVDTAVAALRGGVLDYLLKPFTPEDLLAIVRAAVEKARAVQAAAAQQASIAALVEAAAQVAAGGDVRAQRYAHSLPSSRGGEPVTAPPPDSRDAPFSPDIVRALSPRQLDIVRLLVQGHPLPEVADLLDLSVHTVRGHMKVIFTKLGVQSQVALLSKLARRQS
jgi:DNA-binding NarL/FixJ family response regulator